MEYKRLWPLPSFHCSPAGCTCYSLVKSLRGNKKFPSYESIVKATSHTINRTEWDGSSFWKRVHGRSPLANGNTLGFHQWKSWVRYGGGLSSGREYQAVPSVGLLINAPQFLWLRLQPGTPLMIQWLRICLPRQRMLVQSLVRELRSHRLLLRSDTAK